MAAVPVERVDVAVAGGPLAVYRLGSAGAPPVLAVHGITANSHAWLAVARALEGRASLLAPDLRGRAASNGLPAPYGTAAYVADLVAAIDQLGLGPALVTGHSLGAYISSRLAVEHPDRVRRLLLVDGGLTIPEAEHRDPQQFADEFLGPAIARLSMVFPTPAAYHDWWRAHPAFVGQDVADEDLVAYADHDLAGTEPELHSSVVEAAIRVDTAELAQLGQWASRLSLPARLLCAERGLMNEPNPMQPIERARDWAAADPGRSAELVEDVNHYTITLGSRGAHKVADEIVAALNA